MDAIACRVCGFSEPHLLLIGMYAPFFQLRVPQQSDPFIQFMHISRLTNYLQFAAKVAKHGPKLLTSQPAKLLRVFGALAAGQGQQSEKPSLLPSHRTLMLYCPHCRSATPAHTFRFEDLSGLYRDYRAPSYNRDRISVEPAYAAIVDRVGNDPKEVEERNTAVDAFLRKNAAHLKRGLILDYGGSDGRFVPPCARDYYDGAEILEVSDAALHGSVDTSFVRKVHSAEHGKYTLVTNMHVVEHVGNPRQFVLEALQYVAPGGHLYIETPIELSEPEAADFGAKKIDRSIVLHEHINKYSPGSIAKLVDSTGIAKTIDDAVCYVDLGWTSGYNSQTLVQKI